MPSSAAPTTLRRALLAGAAAATAALGLGALATPSAHAAFTLGRCQGSSSVKGQGASFQAGAQAYFKQVFESSNGCGGTPTGPSYTANGSGNGLASAGAGGGNAQLLCAVAATCTPPLTAGVRDASVAFQSTDEPPTRTQQAAMNAGTASAADDALVHVIPVATGANALIMHAPEGCDLSTVANLTNGTSGTVGGVNTGDGAANKTQRIRLTNVFVEKAFAGATDADTWGEIAPGISGTPANPQETGIARCEDVPVKRIVRFDVSGTTYGWKAYLSLVNAARNWLTTYSTPNNLTWPAAGGSGTATPLATGGRNPDAFCPNTGNKLCSGASSGNGSLADAVNATDGSIGYSDVATARSKGFDVTPSASTQDYTFWSPLQNNPETGAPTGYAEPTLDPTAHSGAIGAKGSNCSNVNVANVPTAASSPNGDPTLGDWSQVYAAGGPVYGACVLTYVLAWDDSAIVYGNTAGEEAEARTVKDYLGVILSGFGQQFAGADYSALPNSIGTPLLDVAQTGTAAIGWNKTAGGGGGGGGGTGGGGGAGGGGGGGGGGTTRTPPSNQFSLPSASTSARQLRFTVQLPGAGALKVNATAKAGRRTIRVASASANAAAGGKVSVKLSLSAAAKRALANASGRKLTITVKFTYTPTGGTAR
ncbi:MAG TPA: hypothetical protein VFS37_02820, partial [Conexibacter sp.]|nr:hypothetical protein [Conexibacter sp.]